MKLLSTEIGDNSIELLYADNQNTDDAETLLIVRLPFEVDPKNSVVWHRYWALNKLQELVREEMNREMKVADGKL